MGDFPNKGTEYSTGHWCTFLTLRADSAKSRSSVSTRIILEDFSRAAVGSESCVPYQPPLKSCQGSNNDM